MLDRIKSFFSSLGGEDTAAATPKFTPQDPRVAAGALMFHVIQADGVLRPIEKDKFRALLKEEYALDSGDLQALVDAAKAADSEAVDLYRFTSILMKNLDREQCVGFVEILWELVYADGVRHELEDNVVWRISELLGVSGRDRVHMRQRVQQRMGIGDGEAS